MPSRSLFEITSIFFWLRKRQKIALSIPNTCRMKNKLILSLNPFSNQSEKMYSLFRLVPEHCIPIKKSPGTQAASFNKILSAIYKPARPDLFFYLNCG